MSPKRVEALPPLDVEAILRALDRHSVEFVLIGGLAAVAHGSPLMTWGLDITPDPGGANLTRLAAALRDLGAPLLDGSLDSAEIVRTTTAAGSVGVCGRPAGGQSYETLVASAETYAVFGLQVLVASLDDLIRSKLAMARDTDLPAVPLLRELRRRRV